jgi:hypothetical protein
VAKRTALVEFSEDIAAKVCGLISEGLSFRKIEMRGGMPSKAGILKWLLEGEAHKANNNPTDPKALFVDHYARVRKVRADCTAAIFFDRRRMAKPSQTANMLKIDNS